MPVEELQERMSSYEFSEWMAYRQINPFGEEREDLRMGIAVAVNANLHTAKGKHFTPKDFMPQWERHKSRYNPQEAATKLQNAFGLYHPEIRKAKI